MSKRNLIIFFAAFASVLGFAIGFAAAASEGGCVSCTTCASCYGDGGSIQSIPGFCCGASELASGTCTEMANSSDGSFSGYVVRLKSGYPQSIISDCASGTLFSYTISSPLTTSPPQCINPYYDADLEFQTCGKVSCDQIGGGVACINFDRCAVSATPVGCGNSYVNSFLQGLLCDVLVINTEVSEGEQCTGSSTSTVWTDSLAFIVQAQAETAVGQLGFNMYTNPGLGAVGSIRLPVCSTSCASIPPVTTASATVDATSTVYSSSTGTTTTPPSGGDPTTTTYVYHLGPAGADGNPTLIDCGIAVPTGPPTPVPCSLVPIGQFFQANGSPVEYLSVPGQPNAIIAFDDQQPGGTSPLCPGGNCTQLNCPPTGNYNYGSNSTLCHYVDLSTCCYDSVNSCAYSSSKQCCYNKTHNCVHTP
ncbi:MAG TPA: hypothetical protein VEF34_19870 [Syntrophobacteraceae bacterium]|nr:hypothetical protein [Syntrophobacteraceae bacterium]